MCTPVGHCTTSQSLESDQTLLPSLPVHTYFHIGLAFYHSNCWTPSFLKIWHHWQEYKVIVENVNYVEPIIPTVSHKSPTIAVLSYQFKTPQHAPMSLVWHLSVPGHTLCESWAWTAVKQKRSDSLRPPESLHGREWTIRQMFGSKELPILWRWKHFSISG